MTSTLLGRTALVVSFLATAIGSSAAAPFEDEWPREIEATEAEIIMYQPQPDTFEGNVITGRAAVSVTRTDATEPVFGAVWLKARVDTDRDERTVDILDVEIERVRFPEATEEDQQRLAQIIEREVPAWEMSLSLDRLLTSLEAVEQARTGAEGLKTAPPKILFLETPAVLISIDGEPELQPLEGSRLMTVVNTPYIIALDTRTKRYYLDGGEIWYEATEVSGPWEPTESVSSEVAALRPEPSPEDAPPAAEGEEEAAEEEDGPPPAILIATEPTELIVSDGPPKWTPLAGGDLLYISNSESDVLMEIEDQRVFLLLSGRWYASGSTAGPWAFVPSDELPAGFAAIPDDSDVAHLRTFVAGTDEAQEALYDAQVPQTSAIVRSEAKLTVTYDGDPKFEEIEATELHYAVNTASAVIQVGDAYYCCDEAVWFVAQKPLGPWTLCDDVPDEIYTIPASCPVYNVIHVHVYDSTPEVVYVGYTPGYTGSYVYGTTIVYGTGWWYRPWYGSVYYARPATWGFHVRWNPWFGWSFGLSYTAGPFRFSVGVGRGWWGPRGWRGYHRGYRHGARRGFRHGYRAGYRAGQRSANRNNMYRNQRNSQRTAHRGGASPSNSRRTASAATNRPNNVYADRNGNVHRQTDKGWENRSGNSWQPDSGAGGRGSAGEGPAGGRAATSDGRGTGTAGRETGASGGATGSSGRATGSSGRTTGSASRSSSSRSSSGYSRSSSSLDRSAYARQRGSSRTQASRSSGGSRGGSRGGGRR